MRQGGFPHLLAMLNKGVRRDKEGFIPPGHINSSLRRKWENRRVNPPRCIEKRENEIALPVALKMGKPTQRGGVTLLIA